MTNIPLEGGVVGPGEGHVVHVLGHTYYYKATSSDTFVFETMDPAGTFVPPHVHPTQDEFIYVLEGTFDLQLDGQKLTAEQGALIKLPRGVPHAYYNNTDQPARALFWVVPAGKLQALFDVLDGMPPSEEVVKVSAEHDVQFI